MGNQLTFSSLSPLTTARTVHIDSAAGSDTTGDGSAAHPWQTIAKGWADRLTYGELRAIYIMQLHGAGPYTMPIAGASVCGDNGFFLVLGDPAVDVTQATGTFTGDLNTTTFIVGTSAGLGSDTQAGRWLYVTSGLCSGARVLIAANTDTSVTVSYRQFRATLGAIANGDTFTIKEPGTVLNFPAAVSGLFTPGTYDWVGGDAQGSAIVARHCFANLSFTGSIARFVRSCVGFCGVKSAAAVQINRSYVQFGVYQNGFIFGVGANSKTDVLSAWGCAFTAGVTVTGGSTVVAVAYASSSFFIGSASQSDVVVLAGGRFAAFTLSEGAWCEVLSSTSYVYVTGTVAVGKGCNLNLNTATWKFAVTSGSCLLLKAGAQAYQSFASVSGGTTDVAGFGVSVLGGGKFWFVNTSPTLTGGTALADLRTTNAVAPNSVLASNGTAAGTAADAALGEVLARVAA